MNRPYLEDRSPAQAQSRAVVIDAAVAKLGLMIFGGGITVFIVVGIWIGATVQGFEGRIGTIEKTQPVRDAQIAALQAVDTEQNRRITALEITITGLGALRERMDQGFSDIAKRLDRIEERP